MTKRLVGLGLVILVLLAAFVGQQALAQRDLSFDPAAYGFRFLAEVGEDYTFTKGVIYNRGDRPIELRGVRVGSISDGLTLVGQSVATSSAFQDSPFVFGPGYPPPEVSGADVHPIDGFSVAPAGGVRLLLGLRVTQPGVHTLEVFTLDYGPALFGRSAVFRYIVRICAPAQAYWGPNETVIGCDTPDPPA